ncbi:MAG: S9 family peptidase [Flavobacteriales bacterium]|nr:S9 family peptidase [Flavobacteriales bacterium]
MKKIVMLVVLAFSMLSPKVNAQEVPVIDRALFFGNPEIAGGDLSPDGKYISFMKEYEGIMNVWVKTIDQPFAEAKIVTKSKKPLAGYFWTKDSKYIVFAKDNDGDENVNIFAVDPIAVLKGSEPESKNLTPLKDVRAQIYMVSKLNPDKMMIGLNDRDKAWHDLYELEISTGNLNKIYENKERVVGYAFDWDEKLRLLYKTDEAGNTTINRLDDNGSSTSIYETNKSESAYIAGWNEDNTKVYLVTNKGSLNLTTLFLMDVKTLRKERLASDPKNQVDIGGVYLNEITRKLTSIDYYYDKKEIHWSDKEWEKIYEELKKEFSGREVDFQSITADRKKFLIAVWGDKYAADVYYYDSETKKLSHQYTPRPQLKEVEKHLAAMQPISYKSSDGLVIPGYLTLPVGKPSKGLPTIVLVHGGPKGPRDSWGYDGLVQFLANRGYAVLQPNFRASGGYGKKFLNAGDLQWGKLMQDDITWGVKHLIAQGIADKDKVVIMGGSYGGYATLAGLAFTPDVYAGGVDIVGPSNLNTLLESVPAYWEAAKAHLYAMVGDPNTKEGRDLINEASPLFSADKINKPLLIIQGANDPRVKQAEADQIVIALREKGKKVSYLLADDEGHGFRKPVNRMAMFAEIEAFLADVLGGVYQKEKPEDVAKRLEELRVDISTVTYQPKQIEVVGALPKINNQFKAETIQYTSTLEVQGQSIPFDTQRTITQQGTNWVVTEVSKSAMGESTEIIEFTADFKPLKRTVSQMGQTFEGTYTDKSLAMTVQGTEINIAFEGAYISDGAGMDLVIAGLPLASGYSISFEVPDMISAKAKKVTLTVEGQEEVNGVKCTKVVLTAEGDDTKTFWINTASKLAEKMEFVIPEFGNAKMTIVKK